MKTLPSLLRPALVSLGSLVALALAGALVILVLGRDPLAVGRVLLEGTLLPHPRTGWYGLGQVLFKATTLSFTGLAVALSFRVGLFNIGAEGQLYAGGFVAALTGLYLVPDGAPALLALPLCLLGAAAGGALAALVPATLKAWRGTHEVIVTIMMNFIVFAVVHHLATGIQEPGTAHTYPVADSARLPLLGLGRSVANASLWVALSLSLALVLFLRFTRSGFEMRAAGLAPGAAETGGIHLPRTYFAALLLSGAIAGLGSVNSVLGHTGYMEWGFSGNAGFLGIAVALLARNHPLLVLPAAFLFALLSEGAVAVGVARDPNVRLPREVFEVLQAMLILFVISATRLAEIQRARRVDR